MVHSETAPRRFADTTLTVKLTGWDAKDLPEDPGRHRLPLAKSPQILSISSICSTSLTADTIAALSELYAP